MTKRKKRKYEFKDEDDELEAENAKAFIKLRRHKMMTTKKYKTK